jgi:hypothetical protein
MILFHNCSMINDKCDKQLYVLCRVLDNLDFLMKGKQIRIKSVLCMTYMRFRSTAATFINRYYAHASAYLSFCGKGSTKKLWRRLFAIKPSRFIV